MLGGKIGLQRFGRGGFLLRLWSLFSNAEDGVPVCFFSNAEDGDFVVFNINEEDQ